MYNKHLESAINNPKVDSCIKPLVQGIKKDIKYIKGVTGTKKYSSNSNNTSVNNFMSNEYFSMDPLTRVNIADRKSTTTDEIKSSKSCGIKKQNKNQSDILSTSDILAKMIEAKLDSVIVKFPNKK